MTCSVSSSDSESDSSKGLLCCSLLVLSDQSNPLESCIRKHVVTSQMVHFNQSKQSCLEVQHFIIALNTLISEQRSKEALYTTPIPRGWQCSQLDALGSTSSRVGNSHIFLVFILPLFLSYMQLQNDTKFAQIC